MILPEFEEIAVRHDKRCCSRLRCVVFLFLTVCGGFVILAIVIAASPSSPAPPPPVPPPSLDELGDLGSGGFSGSGD